jgi:hypothetical protein
MEDSAFRGDHCRPSGGINEKPGPKTSAPGVSYYPKVSDHNFIQLRIAQTIMIMQYQEAYRMKGQVLQYSSRISTSDSRSDLLTTNYLALYSESLKNVDLDEVGGDAAQVVSKNEHLYVYFRENSPSWTGLSLMTEQGNDRLRGEAIAD